MKLTFALVGNQNCGKSTLFNYLTGSNQQLSRRNGAEKGRHFAEG